MSWNISSGVHSDYFTIATDGDHCDSTIRPRDGRTTAVGIEVSFELGANTGGKGKETKYQGKLTTEYRDRYLRWAADCIDKDDNAIHVAERDGDLVGYAFVLPEPLVMIWDAAVQQTECASRFDSRSIPDTALVRSETSPESLHRLLLTAQALDHLWRPLCGL